MPAGHSFHAPHPRLAWMLQQGIAPRCTFRATMCVDVCAMSNPSTNGGLEV